MTVAELVKRMCSCPDNFSLRIAVDRRNRAVDFTLARTDALQRYSVSKRESFDALESAIFPLTDELLQKLFEDLAKAAV